MDHSAIVELSLRRGEMVDISQKVADHSNDSDTIDGEKAWWAACHADLIQFSTGLIGKHVTGYDEADDMVDDSELLSQFGQDRKLESSSFRISVYNPNDCILGEEMAAKEEEEKHDSNPDVMRKLAPFLTEVHNSVSESIAEILADGPVTSARASQSLQLVVQRRKAIADFVDAKIRFEKQLHEGTPTTFTILKWKREAFHMLHKEVFTVDGIEFAGERKLRTAYNQHKREQEQIVTLEVKEPPPD